MFMHGMMIYCVLFLAAFLYFILDPKIKFSFIPGIIITEIGVTSFLWCFVFAKMKPGTLARLINPFGIFKIQKINLIALSAIMAPVICVVLYFLGKLIGKCIFKGAKDRTKPAKVLYIIASITVLFTGIFQSLNSLTLTEESFIKFSNLSSLFLVLSRIRVVLGYLLVSVKYALPVGIILAVTGLICVILINTKIPMSKKEKEPVFPKL